MGAAWREIGTLARRFGRSAKGTAAVEFALIVPIMLVVYIGTMEASSLISMDRKVQLVAGAVGDLVARTDKTLPSSLLGDYFLAAGGIMTPYPADGVVQVVTAVNVADDGTTSVAWSKQFEHGDYASASPYGEGDDYSLPAPILAVSKGKMVIAAEASYAYKPLYGLFFDQAIGLHRADYFLPRFEGTIALN